MLPAVLAAAAALFLVYAPALSGPFVFDDLYLPFGRPEADVWASKLPLGNRPVLMFSFWLNYHWSGREPFSYHAVNVAMHLLVGLLVFQVARRLLGWTGEPDARATAMAGLAGAVFLLHPLHTEAVAYVASRSDLLSTLLTYGALLVFLEGSLRRGAADEETLASGMSFPRAAAILGLTAAAVGSKEQAAVAPGLFLLADYFWNPGFCWRGIRSHWRIHATFALAGAAGLAFVLRTLAASDTAGFGSAGMRWYHYFFTQCRAIWHYLRLTVLPVGQNLDPDFAISRTIWDGGAILGFSALVAVTAAAWVYRKRYPLAAFGWFSFLLLIAPTSSVVPIKDVVAERRAYFPFLGLMLIMLDIARRVRVTRNTGIAVSAAVLCLFGYFASARAALWADPIALWTATAEASPEKGRPRFQLAHALYQAGRFEESVQTYAEASRLEAADYRLLVDWAIALDAAGRGEEALAKIVEASNVERDAHLYATMGMVQAKLGRYGDALESLNKARTYDAGHWPTYLYRGNTFASLGNWADAAVDYRRVLELQPANAAAAQGLHLAETRLAGK
jgi:tetratricopeptide (TPR) repeat protein